MHESATLGNVTDETASEKFAYTVPMAAEALSLGTRTVWGLVKTDQIRSYRVGVAVRISRQALLDYIADREASA